MALLFQEVEVPVALPFPEAYSLKTVIKFLLNSFITLQVLKKRMMGFLKSLHAQREDVNLFLLL